MDCLLGLVGKDFVLIAADGSVSRSVIRFQDQADKAYTLGKTKIVACGGPASDRTNFCEYIQRNIELYHLRNQVELSTKGIANFTRHELATALRKGPYQCNLLLAGYDESTGPSMFYIDYLGSMQKVNMGAHGYGAAFTLSIMDRYFQPDMSLDQAMDLLKKCIHELSTRFLVNMPKFTVKVADKDGVRLVDLAA